MRRPDPGRSRDSGAGSVLVVGGVAVLLLLLSVLLVLGSALTAGARARTAADLAALAGAGQLSVQGTDAACPHAAEVARLNGARLLECRAGRHPDWSPRVSVLVEVDVPVGGLGPARARARAGGVAPTAP